MAKLPNDNSRIRNQHGLQSLFDSTVTGYALIDIAFTVVDFNPKFQEFFKKISGVAISKNRCIDELIGEGCRVNFKSGIKEAFEGKEISDEQKPSLDDESLFKITYTPCCENELNSGMVLISITDLTSERQISQTALEHLNLMNSVFDTGSGIALVSKDGYIVKVNTAFCRILGYTQEDLVKSCYFDLVFQPDKRVLKDRHTQFFSNHVSGSFEVRLVHSDGSILMVLNQTTLINSNNGVPLLIVSITDITERKQAEQELRAREMFYKALLERSADMKVLTSAQGKILFVSGSLTKYLGYSSADLDGRLALDFVPLEDFPHLSILMTEVLREPGISVMVQQRIRHKDGNWRYCEGTVTNLLHDPSVGNLVANFRDVTDKKHSAELLKKSEITLRTIFNSIDIGVVLLNSNMEIIQFNALAASWSKITFPEDLRIGENFCDYISNDNKEAFCMNFSSVLKNTTFNSEVRYRTPAGSDVWYYIRMTPVLDDEDEVTGVCITASDITVRRVIEIEKEKVTQDLIKRNYDLQQFTYIVSHNLRAPTVNIMALSDMLQNYPNLKKSDKEAILLGLKKSSTQLDTVIKDLNFILQIDSDVLTDKRELICFSELLDELLIVINHLIKKEDAQIQVDFDDAPSLVSIRPYLYSIFYNLVTNSLKYRSPDKTPVIKIHSRKISGGVELAFSDNGLGIDLGMHGEKVFRLYSRFHLHKEGKGMGLFMVKTQVEALGGKVEVMSALNEGIVFRIYIPDDQMI